MIPTLNNEYFDILPFYFCQQDMMHKKQRLELLSAYCIDWTIAVARFMHKLPRDAQFPSLMLCVFSFCDNLPDGGTSSTEW